MRILFVCTGNICRSPLAEGILKNKLEKKKVDVEVDSAGLETFHIGDPPDERAIATAAKRGIDISSYSARLFNIDDFDRFDRIFIMDSSHYYAIMRKARDIKDELKIEYTMNMVYPGKDIPIEDPWYDGMDAFEKVYIQLDQACEKITEWIKQKF